MKKLSNAAVLAAAVSLAGAGALSTSYAQQETNPKMVAENSRGAKLYAQYCASCHGGVGEGSDACCLMMSGPNLLSAVQRMNAKAFRDEVVMLEKPICALAICSIFHQPTWKQFGTTYWNFPSKQNRTEAFSAGIPDARKSGSISGTEAA
jgi:Cytochrome C oxidase, cbb3-type, subunit III